MTLVRWNAVPELANFHNTLNRLFSDACQEETCASWTPPVDIVEKGDDLIIRAELPGIDKNEIEIRVEDGTLVLSGERNRETETEEARVYRIERTYGRFTRSFRLPTTVDATKITARYENGVLEVVLPKAEEAKPKKVKIQAA
jgi:HSP20 family protein